MGWGGVGSWRMMMLSRKAACREAAADSRAGGLATVLHSSTRCPLQLPAADWPAHLCRPRKAACRCLVHSTRKSSCLPTCWYPGICFPSAGSRASWCLHPPSLPGSTMCSLERGPRRSGWWRCYGSRWSGSRLRSLCCGCAWQFFRLQCSINVSHSHCPKCKHVAILVPPLAMGECQLQGWLLTCQGRPAPPL